MQNIRIIEIPLVVGVVLKHIETLLDATLHAAKTGYI